jgi:hypothetical protein
MALISEPVVEDAMIIHAPLKLQDPVASIFGFSRAGITAID